MYQSIIEYAVNADLFYRLFMVAEYQTPTPQMPSFSGPSFKNLSQPRREWLPDLVQQFEDPRLVPEVIRCSNGTHNLDSDFRFHTGNKQPTINAEKLELFWGCTTEDVFASERAGRGEFQHPWRESSPAYIAITGLKMWHHQDTVHRRRGDAVICDQIEFVWNTKKDSGGSYRESGPYKIVIKGFRAAYHMGTASDASYQHLGVSWSTENGIRLGEEKVQRIIATCGIKMNYLFAENAFVDPGEEFIFWDEIGRAQEAA